MNKLRALYMGAFASIIVPVTAFAQFGGQMIPYIPQYNSYNNYGGYGGGFGGGLGTYNWQTRAARITTFESLLGIAQTILGYFQVIIFIAALFFALVGAWYIVTKHDFKEGRPYLLYAFVGIVVALLAFTIIPIACWLTQASGPACNL